MCSLPPPPPLKGLFYYTVNFMVYFTHWDKNKWLTVECNSR